MKKKLLALVLVLALAASALSLAACGSDFANIYSNPYENKAYSAYLTDRIQVLDSKKDLGLDANPVTHQNQMRNSVLSVFATQDENNNTVYKVYNYETEQVVLTLTESENVEYSEVETNASYINGSMFDFITVEKITTPEEGDPTTEYLIYYADGTLALSSKESFKLMADATIFVEGDYYRIDKKGKFEKAGTIAKNVAENLPFYMNCVNERYYNISEGALSVYDYSFNLTNYYQLPSYVDVDDAELFVLNDGNVLIQYKFAVSLFESDYTYYNGQNNMKVVTLIYNVKKAETKEIETDALFISLTARDDAFGMLDYLYDDSIKNLATVNFITNKQLDQHITKTVSVKNDGSIDVVLDDAFVAVSDVEPHSSGKFIVYTKLGTQYLVDKKGNVVADITDNTAINEKYILLDGKVYDHNFKELATIDEDKWELFDEGEINGEMNNAFVFRCIDAKDENAAKKFGLFADGQFTVKTFADDEIPVDIDSRYYVIRKDADTTTYTYYNENGVKIFDTTEILTYKGTTRNGKVLLSGSKWDETAGKYVYTNVVLYTK